MSTTSLDRHSVIVHLHQQYMKDRWVLGSQCRCTEIFLTGSLQGKHKTGGIGTAAIVLLFDC